jgi:hypothetical protein
MGQSKLKIKSGVQLAHRFSLLSKLFLNDSVYRATGSASTARTALISIDLELSITFSDSLYRTASSASTAADAFLSNFESHLYTPP